MGKKKGSFTFNDPTAAADAERKATTGGGGPNSVRVVLLDGSYLTIGPVDVSFIQLNTHMHPLSSLSLSPRNGRA